MLGVKDRNEYPDGTVSGGPMYYISKDFKRAAFSNEAGVGTTAIAHSAVKATASLLQIEPESGITANTDRASCSVQFSVRSLVFLRPRPDFRQFQLNGGKFSSDGDHGKN